jgi:4-amino-4-deoxy-L-arabinose transferase-like glycosyltransferase
MAETQAKRMNKPTLGETLKNFWGENLAGRPRSMVKIAAVTACILGGAAMGYIYKDKLWVNGWEFAIWAACILATLLLLTPIRKFAFHPNRGWLVPLGLLLGAFLVRGLFLDRLPPGLHIDEVGTADHAMRYVFTGPGQTMSPFRVGGNSQPSLYMYIIRLSMMAAGYGMTGLRLSSAIAGSLAVLAAYFLVAVFQNRRAAILAAVVMAGYQYAIAWSRLGLNNIWATLWPPLVLACFLWGWKERWSGGAVLAGLALGLSVYFYAGGAVVFFLLAYLLIDLWRHTVERSSLLLHTLKMLAAAACVAAPLLVFAAFEPGQFFDRANVDFAWTPGVIAQVTGSPTNWLGFFWYQLVHSTGGLFVYQDSSGFYAPGIPFLIGLAGPLMLGGLVWAIWKKQYLLIVWLVCMVAFGGMMLTASPAGSHFIAAIPVICWSIAAALNWVMERGWKKLAIAMLVLVVLTDLVFYFVVYPAVPRGDLNMPFPPWPV